MRGRLLGKGGSRAAVLGLGSLALAGLGVTAPRAQTLTRLADIHADLPTFLGRSVAVQGQVYIPTRPGGVVPGYILDLSSNPPSGIALVGAAANDPLLGDVENVVQVVGTVDTVGATTVVIRDLASVTPVSEGNAPLRALRLSAAVASGSRWEGTYIQVTGILTSKTVSEPGAPGEAIEYLLADASDTILVHVPRLVNAREFDVGTNVVASGAGNGAHGAYGILVGNDFDFCSVARGCDDTPPGLVAVTATGRTTVVATFSENIAPQSGVVLTNYRVFETATAVVLPVASVTVVGDVATLTLGAVFVPGRGYSLEAHGVQDLAGNVMAAPATRTFTFGHAPSTPIAAVQGNPASWLGRSVTVQGEVYVPSSFTRAGDAGYIQDASGRGIRVSGGTDASLLAIGNIVQVQGTADTVETSTLTVANPTSVTLLSAANPPLVPRSLTTGAAGSPAWEGTFIEAGGTIVSQAVHHPGAADEAVDYVIDDGSGALTVRVDRAVGADVFRVGQRITARGAGGRSGANYRILVGAANDIFEGSGRDRTPAAITGATVTGTQDIAVYFSEKVTAATAEVPSNYEVFRTNAPSEVVSVVIARLDAQGSRVDLRLAASFDTAAGWSLRVRNVADLHGNAIAAGGVTLAIPDDGSELQGPPRTFLPRLGEVYPIRFRVPSAVVAGGGEVVVRILDLQGRLERTLFDMRRDGGASAFVRNAARRDWDGRDDRSIFVPAGTYIVHLRVTDSRTGHRQELHMPVVVAARMDR